MIRILMYLDIREILFVIKPAVKYCKATRNIYRTLWNISVHIAHLQKRIVRRIEKSIKFFNVHEYKAGITATQE